VAERITRQKVNDIWKSGYCRKIVEHARKTPNTLQGSRDRTEFLQAHITDGACQDCYFAALLKAEEAVVAEAMGPQALGAFMCGEDITKRPGYTTSLVKQAMDRLDARGLVTPEFSEWMHRAAKRKRFKRR